MICTGDEDFFEDPITKYLSNHGINVLSGKALMDRLRS